LAALGAVALLFTPATDVVLFLLADGSAVEAGSMAAESDMID
jgi:hypothetical protein